MDSRATTQGLPSQSRSPETRKRAAEGTPRAKNLQACDRCRRKKIKCQPLDGRRDVCRSCHGAQQGCTFDMPLTASRTKRVRRGLGLEHMPVRASSGARTEDESDGTSEGGSDNDTDVPSPARRRRPARLPSVHREGPTAISFILHAMPTLPLRALTEYDRTAGYTMRLGEGESQDGWVDVSTAAALPIAPSVLEALRSDSWDEVSSRLAEKFLVHVAPLIPIVTRADVGTAGPPLVHAMAAVAAVRSNVSPDVFVALRHMVQRELAEYDVMSIPTRENVQVLLTVSLVDELAHRPGRAAPVNITRTRLAAAVQLARDLGMDRDDSPDARIWRCARVLDVWHAARCGRSPLVREQPLPPVTVGDDFFSQLEALSMLLGRMLKVMYGPDGITMSSNHDLLDVRDRMTQWKDNLPAALKASGQWSGLEAGLLHMLYTGVRFLLYRPVMRWSFVVPRRFELDCDIPAWMDLLSLSRGAIEWAANQDEAADLLFFGPYALTLVCLVQYHTWARRGEWDGAMLLDKARREAVGCWLARNPGDHLCLFKRQLGVVELLHGVTQAQREGTGFDGPRGLNPTPGSLNRLPETSIAGIAFLRDPNLPHGGILVATQKAAREINDLPPGTVILGGHPDGDEHGTNPTTHFNPHTARYLTGLFSDAGPVADRDSDAAGYARGREAVASIVSPQIEGQQPQVDAS